MSDFNLSAFSDAIADIAAAAAPATASFATHQHRTATAFHWNDGYFVTAEEAVEAGEEIELTLSSGDKVKAELVGRDPSTGTALLNPAGAPDLPPLAEAGTVRPGNLAIAVGNSEGAALAVFGTVGEVGPAWRSMRGGTIDRRINLAVNAGSRFEGGPVLDAKGALIGMLLFGPRRRPLVMPYETIERAVATLREKGHVARGYLGAGLHPVRNGDTHGAMVMSLDDNGPAKAAGLHLGDIIVSWNGEAVHGPRELIRKLGPDSAGASVTLGVVRGGERRDVAVTIGEKPLS
ncbi:serine protease [Mesorhizobium sp. M9A.F.Ca.ET.002.03.1.2]|uniref:S1C family serine protease n=1 Tax=Mesorhizobium sp. M9A.F.Ca.ET.002.03.1.2 TaxID=2493668 RepID=UPI000F7629AA|nr:S1C family serine protease [Mesorhizobium sp. M9A.F.Ca.ET.002.03.1.2]AZN95854.1 serine protease [Mesorhizobium sp. M9A.F.Ca.ET.002.03.1.2]